jgi:hypothetical protein
MLLLFLSRSAVALLSPGAALSHLLAASSFDHVRVSLLSFSVGDESSSGASSSFVRWVCLLLFVRVRSCTVFAVRFDLGLSDLCLSVCYSMCYSAVCLRVLLSCPFPGYLQVWCLVSVVRGRAHFECFLFAFSPRRSRRSVTRGFLCFGATSVHAVPAMFWSSGGSRFFVFRTEGHRRNYKATSRCSSPCLQPSNPTALSPDWSECTGQC